MLHRLGFALVLLAGIGAANATGKDAPRTRLIAGLGDSHHPVSTKNPEAQQFFDQGLKLVYGFNHDEARRSFERAGELDPKLAMAWWGVALTLGPNYNLPVNPERERAGYDAIQKAIALQENASEPERAYINALAVRYSNDPNAGLHALDRAYRDAMKKLAVRYPDDLDATTLYAESIMNLNPWKLWTRDGKPADGTEEIIAALESVLKRDPNHLGANHYYIHAVEASPNPERALPSAARLEKLAPIAGHLVHMPSHIYARVGQHSASAHCNQQAVAADKKFLSLTQEQGVYPMMYYSHNLHFIAYANCMDEKFPEAKHAADELVAHVQPQVKEMPMLEGFLSVPFFVLIGFERWNDILRVAAPDPLLIYTTAQWHFARAMAFAGLKKPDNAQNESKLFVATLGKLPASHVVDPRNSIGDIMRVEENFLAAAIKRSQSDEQEADEVLEAFQHAIAAQDNLNYTEPPSFFPPVRPVYGRILLERGNAVAAEKVFRADLQRNPRHRRSLSGLRDSLKAQSRAYEAEQIDQQLRSLATMTAPASVATTKASSARD